jgi:hypothetical protein
MADKFKSALIPDKGVFCIFSKNKNPMKKIYFVVTLLIAAAFSSKAQSVPTCSLDPVFVASTKLGIWPDSATNFISGTVGVPYVQNITVKVPKDTIAASIKICFNRFVLSNPTGTVNYGLPPGLNFGSSTPVVANGTVNGSPSLKFPGNANNCASIYGTPTTAGTYTLHLKVDAYGTPTFGACSNSPNVTGGSNVSTQQLNYYVITINAATGLKEIGKNAFNLENVPNPFTGNTTIRFFMVESGQATLEVHNMLGKKVFSTGIHVEPGTNEYPFKGDNLSEGMYFYTIRYKNFSETKRMILYGN